ncbi:hypothetical protein [Pedobacter sp. KBW01]|uniref:hypothetical protein n=1 Tax=Pedobacter sp. KBW01 TaxID=2153364 RepID=UPI000F590C0F|nr:hypothetical protein [Pedobacter sp. KBW01]
MITVIHKHPQHSHFFVTDGVLCESYKTIRGMRYLEIAEVQTTEMLADITEEQALNLLNSNNHA